MVIWDCPRGILPCLLLICSMRGSVVIMLLAGEDTGGELEGDAGAVVGRFEEASSAP